MPSDVLLFAGFFERRPDDDVTTVDGCDHCDYGDNVACPARCTGAARINVDRSPAIDAEEDHAPRAGTRVVGDHRQAASQCGECKWRRGAAGAVVEHQQLDYPGRTSA